MKPATAVALSVAMEVFAKALREEAAAAGPGARMKLRQASEEYGVPLSTLQDLVLRGEIKGARVGRKNKVWNVSRAEMDRFFRDKEAQEGRAAPPH